MRRLDVWMIRIATVFLLVSMAHGAESVDLSKLNCDNPELLGECLTGVSASRARVESFKVEYEWKETLPASIQAHDDAGSRVSASAGHGVSTLMGLGNLRLKSTTQRLTGPDADAVTADERLSVRGQDFLLSAIGLPEGKGSIQHYEFSGRPNAGSRAQSVDQVLFGDDILNYGFGDGFTTLERHLSMHVDVTRWTVQKQGDGTIKICRYTDTATQKSALPDAEWLVDPARGWLITDVLCREDDGSTYLTTRIEVDKVDGIWFPVAYHREHSNTSLSVRVTNAEINKGVNEESFDWPTFGSKLEGFRGFKSTQAGETKNYIVRDGLPIEGPISAYFEPR